MLDMFRRLATDPEETWNTISASRPRLWESLHPLSTLGILAASLAAGLGFVFRGETLLGVKEFFLHVLADSAALAVLAIALKREIVARRGAQFALPAGSLLLAAGGLAMPVWALSTLLIIPLPVADWFWLLLGLGLSAYQYRFVARSLVAVPQSLERQSLLRVLGPFAAALVALRVACNLVAGSAFFIR